MTPIYISLANQIINLSHVENVYRQGVYLAFKFSNGTKVEIINDNDHQAQTRLNQILMFLDRDPRRFIEHIT